MPLKKKPRAKTCRQHAASEAVACVRVSRARTQAEGVGFVVYGLRRNISKWFSAIVDYKKRLPHVTEMVITTDGRSSLSRYMLVCCSSKAGIAEWQRIAQMRRDLQMITTLGRSEENDKKFVTIPALISDDETEKVRDAMIASAESIAPSKIRVGVPVRVVGGPFKQFVGTVVKMFPDGGMAEVEITLFGRPHCVTLALEYVKIA